MKELNTQKTALVVGLFIGGWHLIWSLLIATGLAQLLLDFVYWLHMLNNPFQVAPFNLTRAALLIVVTFVVGCAGGWFFALLWNKLHKS